MVGRWGIAVIGVRGKKAGNEASFPVGAAKVVRPGFAWLPEKLPALMVSRSLLAKPLKIAGRTFFRGK